MANETTYEIELDPAENENEENENEIYNRSLVAEDLITNQMDWDWTNLARQSLAAHNEYVADSEPGSEPDSLPDNYVQCSMSDYQTESNSSDSSESSDSTNDEHKFRKMGYPKLMNAIFKYLSYPEKERRNHWPFENMTKAKKTEFKRKAGHYKIVDNKLMYKRVTKHQTEDGETLDVGMLTVMLFLHHCYICRNYCDNFSCHSATSIFLFALQSACVWSSQIPMSNKTLCRTCM